MSKLIPLNNIKHYHIIGFLLIIGAICWYIVNFFWGERVWYNHGAGWDGLIYANMTTDFEELLKAKKISSYRLTHAFPVAVIYYFNKLFGITLTETKEIVRAYIIYNYILVLFLSIFAIKICNHLKFNIKTRFIVISALFLTVPLFKKFMYIPIGTDVTAFFVGIMSFYFFIKKQNYGLFIISLIGAFTYPSIAFANVLLLAINRQIKLKDIKSRKYDQAIKLLVLGFIVVGLNWVLAIKYQSISNSQQLNEKAIVLSIISIIVYIYFVIKPIKLIPEFTNTTIKGIIKYLFLGAAFLVVFFTLRDSLSGAGYKAQTPVTLLKAILYGSITNPLAPLICHISYYGPFIILLIIFWRKILNEIEKLGLPIFLFIGLYLVLGLGRESRQFINAWPVFVFVGAIYLNKIKFNWTFIYVFTALSLIFSKFWFTINVPGISMKNGLQEFPAQRFFMMNGAWMSTRMYYVHLIAAVLTFLIIFALLKINKIKIYDKIPRSSED